MPSGLLVCPACRHLDHGNLHVHTLDRSGSVLICRGCRRRHPIVDGIPVVLRDLAPWAASEGLDAIRRYDLDDEILDLLVPPGAATARNRRLLGVYGAPLPSPFRTWMARRITELPGPILEIGAGMGHPGTVRIDTNLAVLRSRGLESKLVETEDGVVAAPGLAVVADAADPPFLSDSFPSVVLANVLDTCPDPFLVLAQADALVAPRGTLVVSCPYAFADDITPKDARFGEEDLLAALGGRAPFGPHDLSCRTTEVVDELRWTLRIGHRSTHEHRVQVVVARKIDPAAPNDAGVR